MLSPSSSCQNVYNLHIVAIIGEMSPFQPELFAFLQHQEGPSNVARNVKSPKRAAKIAHSSWKFVDRGRIHVLAGLLIE